MPLTLYKSSPHMDMYLSKLYTDILYSGEAEKVLGERMQSLYGFLAGCQSPNICLLGFDGGEKSLNGAWLWTLLEPCYDGGFFSLWIKKEKRQSKQAFALILDAYHRYFEFFPVLMGVTYQKDILEEHQRLGYKILGKVTNLKKDKDIWIMTCHREDFLNSTEKFNRLIQEVKILEDQA